MRFALDGMHAPSASRTPHTRADAHRACCTGAEKGILMLRKLKEGRSARVRLLNETPDNRRFLHRNVKSPAYKKRRQQKSG